MVERRLSVGVFARFDEQVCDLAGVVIVAAVSDVIAIAADKLVGRGLLVVHIRFIATSDGGETLRGALGEHFVERPPRRRMLAQVQLVLFLRNASLFATPFV